MKTFILFSLLLIITTTAFTQILKGQFLIGGSINFESIKNEYSTLPAYKSRNLFVSPNVGYFIIDKLGSGLRIDFRSYNQESENSNKNVTNTSFSPFLRYYFLPSAKKVNAFLNLSYIHNKTKFNAYSERSRGYYVSAGPSIFLSSQVALEFTLGYKHTVSDNFYKTKSNIFNSEFGLQIHLGRIRNR